MRTLFLFLIALFSSNLQAVDSIDALASESLASTEGLIRSIVGGHVSVISGDFVDHEVDLAVPGPVPLALERSYHSSNNFLAHLHQSWQLAEPSELIFSQDMSYGSNKLHALVTTTHGARAKYEKEVKSGTKGAVQLEMAAIRGFTNCGSGPISGKTNLKNNILTLNDRDKKLGLSGELIAGDKSVRSYVWHYVDTQNRIRFALIKEKKLNGTRKTYSYHPTGRVHEIRMGNLAKNIEYSKLTFTQNSSKEGSPIIATAPNGKSVSYYFEPESYKSKQGKFTQHYLTRVERSDKPTVTYTYEKTTGIKHHHLLKSKSLPHGRKLEVVYYREGDNAFWNQNLHLKKDSRIIGRVKELKAPVGKDDKLITTHLFYYNYFQKNGVIKSGNTEVYDVYSRRTTYFYDDEERLSSVHRYQGANLHSKEAYFWENGQLTSKYTQDPQGQVIEGRVFYYDGKGNITHAKSCGKVSGKSSPGIVLDGAGRPINNGAESYACNYAYDSNNSLIAQREDNGKGIGYTYLPGTDALVSKIVDNGAGGVLIREFNAYDGNLFLLRKVIDDGKAQSPTDLTGVTCQKITYYFPRTTFPFGLNEKIEEKYLDLKTGEEKLLKRVIYTHSLEGRVLKEDHYDSEGIYRYSRVFDYDAHGHLIKEVNALGETILRSYDENDNCVFEKGPSFDYELRHAYDFMNRLIQTKEIHTDGQCFTTSHSYDLAGNRIATVDRYGHLTEYAYDDFNRVKRITYPAELQNNVLVKPTETFEYDLLGHVTLFKDKQGHLTHTVSNCQGSPTLIEHPDGTKEQFEYRSDGQLIKHTLPTGVVVKYQKDCLGRTEKEETYSDNGELLAVRRTTHNSFNLLSEEDPEGIVTTYEYDGAGRLITTLCGDQKTSLVYDSLGRIEKEINYLSSEEAQVTVYSYDLLNRVLEERVEDLSGKITSSLSYRYNVFGQRIETKQGDQITLITYNTHQDPIYKQDAEGDILQTTYEYNYRDEQLAVVRSTTLDPLGNKTVAIQNKEGKTLRLTGFNALGQLLSEEVHTYNLGGDLIRSTYSRIVNGKQESSVTHEWTYDAAHCLLSQVEAVGTPEQRTHTYTYNTLGQKTSCQRPDETSLHYAYNDKGLLAKTTSSDLTIAYAYTYNKNDDIIEVWDLILGTQTFRTYDGLGRIAKETLGNGLSVSYTYDPLDRKQTVGLPDGSTVCYAYDSNYLRSVKHGDHSFSYDLYDAVGNLLEYTLPASAGKVSFTYDRLNRRRSLTHPSFTQTIPEEGFDGVGNLRHQQMQDPLGMSDLTYAYDDLYQLTEEEGHSYAYDSLNNRIVQDGAFHEVNALSQLLKAAGVAYSYDLNGNLIQKNDGNGITTYTYDAWNRMIKVVTPDVSVSYTYDAFNRRLAKSGALEEVYLYDGQEEIGIYKGGKLHTLRVLGIPQGASSSAFFEVNGELNLPLHDHAGHVRVLVDVNGSAVKTYRYTAFGEELDADPSDINPWRFSSKHFDPEIGLIYFGHRYYDPVHARWTTPDPAEYVDGANRHAYLRNNPLIRFDPYGLWAEEFLSVAFSPMKGFCNAACEDYCDRGVGYYDSFCSAAAWIGADFEYEYGNDPSLLNSQMEDSYEDWRLAKKAFTEAPRETSLLAFAPGVHKYENLGPNASPQEKGEAFGRMAYDAVNFIPRLTTAALGGFTKLINKAQKVSAASGVASKAAKGLGSAVRGSAAEAGVKASRNRFFPDINATGAHSVFRRDSVTRKVTHYETYRPQTNPRNPSPWESIKRFDNSGKFNQSHFNKVLDKHIYEPHVHDPVFPGGIRPAQSWEIP